jgi:Ca2+-transporting ATPase
MRVVTEAGLTSDQAQQNLVKFGPNIIFKKEKIEFFKIAKQEITEPMILFLLIVGVIYGFWGGLSDAITIFVIILALVFAEVFNEYRAKKAIASLEKISAPKTKVLRDNKIVEISSELVVPGDILILVSGTKIAADAKISQSIGMQIDESALTGESFPRDASSGKDIFAGTTIISGEGQASVVVTGTTTKLGQIAASAQNIKPPRTTLQLAMKSLSGKLVYVAIFFSVAIPILGIIRGQNLKTMILTGLSLSFATIPEELPIVITMVLGLGAYTLSKHNFLVKKLRAAETLGGATVIVTDKTGTITENRQKIVSYFPNQPKSVIKSASYALTEFSISPLDEEIKNVARQYGPQQDGDKILSQSNFENNRKIRLVLRDGDELKIYASGAPEEIFAICKNVSKEVKNELLKQVSKGRRVIAIASQLVKNDDKRLPITKIAKGLDFIGLIGFEDLPRKGVKNTISQAARAGIRTIMVTGDHPLTAAAIASEVGIISKNNQVVLGTEIDNMSDEQLQTVVKNASIFARTTPDHKYRIVSALQRNGEIVAVTGDGINDVLALKSADIGIAMGLKGTDVAKDAAEVVLADDNFVTIARGIFEGRKFFDNLRKGIKYYLSVKTALILIFLLPVIIGVAMPFTPIQIIVLELFMDLAASAGFVSEPQEKNIYKEKPRNPKADMFDRKQIIDVLVKGTVLFTAVSFVYFFALSQKVDLKLAQSYAFSAWIFAHIFLAYISRSDKESVFAQRLFKNKIINIWAIGAISFLLCAIYIPFLHDKLNLIAINPVQLILIALSTAIIVGSLEIRKLFLRE